jgi:3'(2'), 5'-bisphosphate nucleotidase
MSGESAEKLHQALAAGQLRILAGRIKEIAPDLSGAFCIRYLKKGSKEQVTLEADVIVNCMGPDSNYLKLQDPFVVNLIKRGMIRTDALRLGIDCTPEGVVIGGDGEPIPYLYTIGPPARGALWEITSIPDIRVAAGELARRLTATVRPLDLAALIEPLRELTARAGDAILDIYNDQQYENAFTLKEDRTPLTQADHTSNAIIIKGLQALTPSIPVISEENGVIPFEIRKHWKYYWCVDPLDGTKEFLQKNGEFCINIALIHHQVPILGVIYIPLSGNFYYGSRETGSWRMGVGQAPIRLYADNAAKDWTAVSSRSHKSREELHSDVHPKVSRRIVAGSALKFCLIAEGMAHLYHRQGPTMEWDTAAGHAIVEFSGGKLCTITGGPLLYNKETLLNDPFICSIDQMI